MRGIDTIVRSSATGQGEEKTARRARGNKDKKIRKKGDDDDASGKSGVCFDLEA